MAFRGKLEWDGADDGVMKREVQPVGPDKEEQGNICGRCVRRPSSLTRSGPEIRNGGATGFRADGLFPSHRVEVWERIRAGDSRTAHRQNPRNLSLIDV